MLVHKSFNLVYSLRFHLAWPLEYTRHEWILKGQARKRKAEKVVEAATVQSPYLSYEEAAEYTNLSAVTLWRAVRDGRLRPAGPGKAIRFHKGELDRFMYSRGR